tara:strand:- start:18472 stop:18573 length:102 start_codon:yes stop_codon:yes gene_type:complete
MRDFNETDIQAAITTLEEASEKQRKQWGSDWKG